MNKPKVDATHKGGEDAVAALRECRGTLSAKPKAEGYKCGQAKIVGFWNCPCAECRQRKSDANATAAMAKEPTR